ncbi:MAG: xanthine dehydrogenase family protein molybdopterin-binding subunit [Pseudomonadota bacterium]
MKFGFGAAVRRTEDFALIRGQGNYTADLMPDDAARAVVLRSPMGHADFKINNAEDVRQMPGVLAVLTAAEVCDLGPLPCVAPAKNHDGSLTPIPDNPVLPASRVRHVGDAMAMVIAETEAQARDAGEAFDIDFTERPAVADMKRAIAAGAPQIHNAVQGNLAFDWRLGDAESTQTALSTSARVIELELVNNRIVTNYLEPRAAIGEIEEGTGRYVLTCGSQGVHGIVRVLAGQVFKTSPDKFHVKTPDVGGGFGTKIFCYREYALVLRAAELIGRPVVWIGDRTEHFLGDYHGRDNITRVRLGLDEKGKITALDVDTLANMGAYLSHYGPFVPTLGAPMLPGVYRVPVMHSRVRGVYTNTVPVDAYRGAGRPEATVVIERIVDKAARELGLKPEVFRKRNYIPPSYMPYKTAGGRVYDSGEFAKLQDAALDAADYKGFRSRMSASRKAGKLRGIGFATYIEACAGGGPENARVRLEKDGQITVLIGTQSNGQGHATAYAQLVADQLAVPSWRVNVVQGDSDLIKTGGGTGGSRSLPVGGMAVKKASSSLAEKIREQASDMLEASAGDLEFSEKGVRIAGTDKAVALSEIAVQHDDPLEAEEGFAPSAPTYPNGIHVIELEVDPETGNTDILRYTIVDDFGRPVNPMLLEGQVHGGVAQGIGQALLEHTVYEDETGQLLTATYMDYTMPRADDLTMIDFSTRNVPCKTNPLGIKGAGEAGAIGATPAFMNALVDALHRAYGITHVDMPATPQKLWQIIQEARKAAA